jgi:hypothetical protein
MTKAQVGRIGPCSSVHGYHFARKLPYYRILPCRENRCPASIPLVVPGKMLELYPFTSFGHARTFR